MSADPQYTDPNNDADEAKTDEGEQPKTDKGDDGDKSE